MNKTKESLQTVENKRCTNDVVQDRKTGSGVQLSDAERITIQTLKAQGVSVTDIARQMGRNRKTIAGYLADSARDIVTANLDEYARLHLDAARNAAAKGDSKPAEWAMERAKVVDNKPQASESKGFTVKIGVMLPNLGESAGLIVQADGNSQVVDTEDDS